MYLKLKMPHPTTPWPRTAESALTQGIAYYLPPADARNCSFDAMTCRHNGEVEKWGPVTCGSTLYYSVSQMPVCEAWDQANNEYFEAKANGEPLNAGEAIEQGKDYYWAGMPGRFCGHPGMRTIDNKCYICEHSRTVAKSSSPRQLAKAAGNAWYMPSQGDLCSKGHHALRRVNNGECSECNVTAKQAEPKRELSINKQFPDMLVDYESAKGMGFKVYRTGKACSKGHADWRYVSTRGCLTCMGR